MCTAAIREQWDAPNVWAPLQHIIVLGLPIPTSRPHRYALQCCSVTFRFVLGFAVWIQRAFKEKRNGAHVPIRMRTCSNSERRRKTVRSREAVESTNVSICGRVERDGGGTLRFSTLLLVPSSGQKVIGKRCFVYITFVFDQKESTCDYISNSRFYSFAFALVRQIV